MTRADFEKRKQDWVADPCWDIEGDVDEFPEFKEELLAFAKKMRAEWAAAAQERQAQGAAELDAEAERLGVAGARELIRHIKGLEQRLSRLSDHVEALEFQLKTR